MEIISAKPAQLTSEYNKGLTSGALVGFIMGIVTTLIIFF